MKINADFTTAAYVATSSQEWIASPMSGVDRKPLDRVGEEVARATSIVRYAPKSSFSPHVHSGGEEFVVLEGVFQDEHGDYPVGSYVRNPPQSRHKPSSADGCVIFVKLWQFQADDRQHVNIDMTKAPVTFQNSTKELTERLVYKDVFEEVKYVVLAPNAAWKINQSNGIEILLLDGKADYEDITLAKHDWLRIPQGISISLQASAEGAKLWLKTGNIADVKNQIKRVVSASKLLMSG